MRNIIKRVLFGKRKNYRKRDYNVKYWELNDIREQLGNTQRKLNNLMSHLGVDSIGHSNLVGDKKDGKKFAKQWD